MEGTGIYLVGLGAAWTGWWLRGVMERLHKENLWQSAREIAVKYPENGETQQALYELAKHF